MCVYIYIYILDSFYCTPETNTTLSSNYAFWKICMQVKKQQLELDMEQQTGSKSISKPWQSNIQSRLYNDTLLI